MSLKSRMFYMNPYEVHKALINDYLLRRPGDTKLMRRDSSGDRTDLDVLRNNHKFLWEEESPQTWEAQFAKKYYDKLFKEYCIGDLSRYKENKVALRWRTEQEVVIGKGQFICACKTCSKKKDLKTWEVNFAYQEEGLKKNALIKIRLCLSCSKKLNYHSKKREIKRIKQNRLIGNRKHKDSSDMEYQAREKSDDDRDDKTLTDDMGTSSNVESSSPWENLKPVETKTRDEEMEDYLMELLV